MLGKIDFFREHILCLTHLFSLYVNAPWLDIPHINLHLACLLSFPIFALLLSAASHFFYTTLFSSCQIDWHKGKDVTVKTIKKKQKHKGRGTVRTVTKQVPNDSFFNFFNPIKGENLHRNGSLRLHRISVQVKNSYLTPNLYLTYQ